MSRRRNRRSTHPAAEVSARTLGERAATARRFDRALGLEPPIYVDDVDDSAARAYDAHPFRFYVLGADGRVAYRTEKGVAGFDDELSELRAWLTARSKRLGLPNAP